MEFHEHSAAVCSTDSEKKQRNIDDNESFALIGHELEMHMVGYRRPIYIIHPNFQWRRGAGPDHQP